MKLDKAKMAVLRRKVQNAKPKGWRVRLHKYLDGVRCNVYAAPVDLLQVLKNNGLNLHGAMSFEFEGCYVYDHYLTLPHNLHMRKLHEAIVGDDGSEVKAYMAIGTKDEPFLHIVKPPKQWHPKVAAYMAHAKKMEALKAEQEAKKLVPSAAKKWIKQAHHSWV